MEFKRQNFYSSKFSKLLFIHEYYIWLMLCHYTMMTKIYFSWLATNIENYNYNTQYFMEMRGNNTSNNFNIFKYYLYDRSIVFKNSKLVGITNNKIIIVEHFFRFQC